MIHVISPRYKAPTDANIINTTSRSQNWSRGLSPFVCGPVDLYDGYKSICVENAWQYSKVYGHIDHIDDDGNPTEAYFKWAKAGWDSIRADRYPMGKGVAPQFTYWDGEKLGYVEARKKVYIPLYAEAVKKTEAFKKLAEIYNAIPEEETLYLWDFDAHSLTPGTFDYWDLWNNPNIKVGHAYVLAMLLEKIDLNEEEYKRKRYKCPFKQYQLVKFVRPDKKSIYPFMNNEILLFLGEIVQMKGHCIVVNRNGQVYWGYHTDDFVEPNEGEI